MDLLLAHGPGEEAARDQRLQFGRLALARGLSLLLLMLALKVWLAVWYYRAGINPLAEIRPALRPLLAGVDLLSAGLLCVAIAAIMQPARWLQRGRFFFVTALPLALHLAVVALLVVSLKLNELYGRPISFELLEYASHLKEMRDSMLAMVDAQTVLFTLAGAALFWAGPVLFRATLRRVSARAAWAGVLVLSLAAGGASRLAFKSVYAYGLKKNGLLELARSFSVSSLPEDYARKRQELERALRGEKGAAVDRTPIAGGHPAPGLASFAGKARGLNLLVLVLESTAARYVDARTAPTLDGLERRGMRFERHYTSAPFTFDAQYALFYSHEIRDLSADYRKLYGGPPADASLFEVFRGAGYRTALFASAFLYFHDQGWLFERKGVDTLESAETLPDRGRPHSSWGVDERDTVDSLSEWLARRDGRPFLAVYNPITPHHPYSTPAATRPFAGYGVEDNYRNALAYTDAQISRLLQNLDALGLSSRTVVALVSDHGESLAGPRGAGHGLAFSDAELRVPFAVAVPGAAAETFSAPTNHLDFAPTLAALFGIAPDPRWEGRNLLAPRVEPRLLYVGIGVGNLMGCIDGERAFSLDLNRHSTQLYAAGPDELLPAEGPPALLSLYRDRVAPMDPKLTLRHLQLALRPGRRSP